MYFCCAIYILLNILKDIMAGQITNCLESHSIFIETQHIYSEKIFNLRTFTFCHRTFVARAGLNGETRAAYFCFSVSECSKKVCSISIMCSRSLAGRVW